MEDYDQKFEEMKKYIPFLESMIKRLENNRSENPRQAQLAKIRSLRDLLLDKKKRMKMENLLKCEQVLVNLYAKVEQRDGFGNIQGDLDTKVETENAELNFVRSKLKNISSHLRNEETLPEIARASNTEETCTAGSKEPALFQRRPIRLPSTSPAPSPKSNKSSPVTSDNRNYTRVLKSPDCTTNWPQDIPTEKQLYSRRSPRRTPRKSPQKNISPNHKKEKKNSVNKKDISKELKDLNITLKVPQETLDSLNTKDILSRIINCSDSDVDIDTLRGLRTQILSELKQTGAKDDISDLILKSYKHKKKSKKKKEDIEEGELSDSESEIIESIYGNLVIMDNEQSNKNITQKVDKMDQESRKIQICLVINSENDGQNEKEQSMAAVEKKSSVAESDFESLKDSRKFNQSDEIKDNNTSSKLNKDAIGEITVLKSHKNIECTEITPKPSTCESSEICKKTQRQDVNVDLATSEPYKPNFYKPFNNTDNSEKISKSDKIINENKVITVESKDDLPQLEVKIPLLDLESSAKKEEVHEIDILKALKQEILSEKISDLAESETITPLLHQPKVTKVADRHGLITKKRISIEKYKEKTITSSKPFFYTDGLNSNPSKDELLRKQSIKLTEKECERFNLSHKLLFDESSEEEETEKSNTNIDIYADLAPKSPDHDDFADTGIKPPVIIPVDPIKTTVVTSKSDVDMRFHSTANTSNPVALKPEPKTGPTSMNTNNELDNCKDEIDASQNDKRFPSFDPRVRRDYNQSNSDNSVKGPLECPSRLINFPSNIIPKAGSNMTPTRMQNPNIIPSMTTNPNINRNLHNMTPSLQTFENDDCSKQNHVYSPIFSSFEYEANNMVNKSGHSAETFSFPLNPFENIRNDLIPNNDFHNPNNIYAENNPAMFSRSECPPTPIHPFGMSDCQPPQPRLKIPLLETPMTPINSFGRCDGPLTPVHAFGRGDCPPTPNHPFGRRTEMLMTPNHPFGRTDFTQTQMASPVPTRYNNFIDHNNINRNSDYNNYSNYNEENDYTDKNPCYNPRNYEYDQAQRNFPDPYRHYSGQKNSSNSNSYDQRDPRFIDSCRRETSIGRSRSTNYKNTHKGYRARDYSYEKDSSKSFSDGNYLRSKFKLDNRKSFNKPDKKNVEEDFSSDKVMSVESHAGRSFVIDTSVSTSFQGKLENQDVSSFDARRRRASSVGRSFIGEEKFKSDEMNTKYYKYSLNTKNTDRFRRACSVGKDRVETNDIKNFKDIKEELKSYKYKNDERFNKSKNVSSNNNASIDARKKNFERDPRLSRRDEYDLQREKNKRQTKTFPHKGYYRDPRCRKDEYRYHKNSPHSDTRSNSREDKKHGIVYSSDNIAKGVILGSGYGVKNYKIPKIKRNLEEINHVDSKEKVKNSKDNAAVDYCSKKIEPMNEIISDSQQEHVTAKDVGQKKERRSTRWNKSETNEPISKEMSETLNKVENSDLDNSNASDNIEKRITRSSKKNASHVLEIKCESPNRKTNKLKKSDSQDSNEDIVESISVSSKDESPTNIVIMEKDVAEVKNVNENINDCICSNENATNGVSSLQSETSSRRNDKQIDCNIYEKVQTAESETSEIAVSNSENNDVADQNNCFGPELEMFSDNVAVDPVIENINALIADLDDDLETSKNDGSKNQFTKEISLENMLDNITCTENKSKDATDEKEKCCNINELCTDSEVTENISSVNESKSLKEYNVILNNTSEFENKPLTINNADNESVNNSEVSTTEELNCNKTEKTTEKCNTVEKMQPLLNENVESCSTPDSTIDVNESSHDQVVREGVPDSTNELSCEMSSDITSTHPCESKDSSEANTSSIEPLQPSDSISSLLSILKDKSKIKELLTMLKDQSSENDKLKKKLEKLSEIVSDDEDFPPSKPNVSDDHSKLNDIRNTKLPDQKPKKYNCEEGLQKTETVNIDSNDNEKIFENPSNDNEQSNQGDKEIEDDKHLDKIVAENENNVASYSQNDLSNDQTTHVNKKSVKNQKSTKRGKAIKNSLLDEKPETLIECPSIEKGSSKKPSRELKQLQEDIKEMFMHDNMFNATGIRMCRLAKLVEGKPSIDKDDRNKIEEGSTSLIERAKNDLEETTYKGKSTLKKRLPAKSKLAVINYNETFLNQTKPLNIRPGPKSKTKLIEKLDDSDPYVFEADSYIEPNQQDDTISKYRSGSESEYESLASSNSYGSNDVLADFKKKTKRKRRGWQAGVIRPKQRKKMENKNFNALTNTENTLENTLTTTDHYNISDMNCYTDKSYCFSKNLKDYACRLCTYNGHDIVRHHRKQHPHSEVPLSRISSNVAEDAIQHCEKQFLASLKVPFNKYVCRFCFREFARKKFTLEAFFWHVVSEHTGEYKQTCTECIGVDCKFRFDIPPPPKESKDHLIGYICEKCNFTQVSLENLKAHVTKRHDDDPTVVYTINLSATVKRMPVKKTLNTLTAESEPRVLRSKRFSRNTVESSEEPNNSYVNVLGCNKESKSDSLQSLYLEKSNIDRRKIQSKIYFEKDDTSDEISELLDSADIKVELEEKCNQNMPNTESSPHNAKPGTNSIEDTGENVTNTELDCQPPSDDVLDYPHFKINLTEAGTKEYVCCINGTDNHYKTALLISFKKHVQLKHTEKWDGFCFLCKLIVTTQGNHLFKDCLQHFLDQHIDSFPIMEKKDKQIDDEDSYLSSKSYLNVRPLSELISRTDVHMEQSSLPVIESVVSLGASTSYENVVGSYSNVKTKEVTWKYEEAQANVIANKNNIVLEIMMNRDKIVHIFKCAGRFCSYTTDNAEDALRHAVAHERIGGEGSLDCAYCDFDSSKNAVDLVTHVFKVHGSCPYVCGRCFYRGAASQLVRAHELRKHPKDHSLVYRSTVTARSNTTDDILPREIAVPSYECNQDLNNGGCQFKTYTSGKFSEHLQTRHSKDGNFSCFLCPVLVPRSMELIQHLKGHGFKVYQCTWCIYGAENETEFLAHASEVHPNKLPQAYLRIITNKEGTTGFRVLPLAHLNNSKIATIDVVPNSVKGNPEREAERSIDLEKLIGQTAQMIENIITYQSEPNNEDAINDDSGDVFFDSESIDRSQEEPLVLGLKSSKNKPDQDLASITAIPPKESPKSINTSAESDLHNQLTSVKTEPKPATSDNIQSDVVYCLDSDDEAPNENVIDLSGEESAHPSGGSGQPKRVPITLLYKCSLCVTTTILRNSAGFKRHVTSSHAQSANKIPCAHCSFVGDRDTVAKHYETDHSACEEQLLRYVCGVCSNKYVTFAFVKKHLKKDHNVGKLAVTSKQVKNGEYHYVVSATGKCKVSVKRKLSNDKNESVQPSKKMKKFGPSDIDSLPINPILDELVYCALCEYNTKVRLNLVRHLQLHAEQQPVPQVAPVNPVPHLETNEKHFDKMLNLASSSIASRLEKTSKAEQSVVNSLIPPEAALRYPKFVPDRQRYTCGAKGCCYISLDEEMLKYHWETLHSDIKEFHCIHCPPHQQMDTSKPLSAARIITHLKMHDVNLYACSICHYHHNRRHVTETHIEEFHNSGNVLVVREEGETVTSSHLAPSSAATPTMDLKPWQCGLCQFKSMLRPEVVEHCAKVHQSKMQYKCTYCAFRTSTLENITKHQGKSHAGKAQDTFYFYYREGSIANEPDGTPRWQKQRLKSGMAETQVKTEAVENKESESQAYCSKEAPPLIAIPAVDLNIVKRDPDAEPAEERAQDLCKNFNPYCEPNGLKYKCPLCENVCEETKEAMQSHLYEEWQYRKWGCGFCSYKAFHEIGLKEHMTIEHRQYRDPIELPIDSHIESWVAKALDHQFILIEKNRHNLAKQVIVKPSQSTSPSTSIQISSVCATESNGSSNNDDLENMFGKFGSPEKMFFKCPKCNFKIREENGMRNHLEIELNKIRWCCSTCPEKFQNYHEAQFHCKSAHAGQVARALEAARDVAKRAAWISAVLQSQKLSMALPLKPTVEVENLEVSDNNPAPENSLLRVRYVERIPTPEVETANLRSSLDSDDDEEKLIIDEPFRQAAESRQCPFCAIKCKGNKVFKEHLSLSHGNIKPYFCSYCDFNGHRKTVINHLNNKHPDKPPQPLTKAQRIAGLPLVTIPTKPVSPIEDDAKLICLRCEKPFTDNEAKGHLHEMAKPAFAKKGQVVVKCCHCQRLHLSIEDATAHHHASHPSESLNYAYYKIHGSKRTVLCCAYCEQQFKFWNDLKAHWQAIHSSLPLQFNKRHYSVASNLSVGLSDDDDGAVKRKSGSPVEGPPPKMFARKSTTKLPLQAVAKKSTTKLPSKVEPESEYCHYGSKPRLEDVDNIKTSMTFCNTDVMFTFKQLSEVVKINPIVVVEDVQK